ncbi:unnamed protein product [Discosporangium mesarthrocarpum]
MMTSYMSCRVVISSVVFALNTFSTVSFCTRPGVSFETSSLRPRIRRTRPRCPTRLHGTHPDTNVTEKGKRSKRGKYPVVELWRKGDIEGWAPNSAAASSQGEGTTSRGGSPEVTALSFLEGRGFSREHTDEMLETFPALAHIPPEKLDIGPKLRFICHTMGAETSAVSCYPQYFGHPLERHIAPRHAFLVSSGQSVTSKLLDNGCRGLRKMLELPVNRFVAEMAPGCNVSEYQYFEQRFLRGPFEAARKGDTAVLNLLRSHGWDCWERDRRGRTALHWAAGAGSLDACQALTAGKGGIGGIRDGVGVGDVGEDGSTPLHWAATGVTRTRFGAGGHPHVCRWLVSEGADSGAVTSEGNTVLMWAAWAGGLEVTRWAVEEAGSELGAVNKNGCSVAHWAASGGDEGVCRYLFAAGVDFTLCNNGGNDPLNHAVAYGRDKISAWLLDEVCGESAGGTRHKEEKVLLDLANLTGDTQMQGFLLGGSH